MKDSPDTSEYPPRLEAGIDQALALHGRIES